ncbi:MAG: elongation factor Ts [Bradymonadales bacterium]|nr:elongation factor Ts [Bradymonadales bacterium]
MEITASLVKELREITGAGMMDCKKALQQCDGNLEEAKLYLEKKGISDSRKRAGRIASEGLVVSRIAGDGRSGLLVEVNCETDFVARNEEFVSFVEELADQLLAQKVDSEGALAAMLWDGKPLEQYTLERMAKLKEKVSVRRLDWVRVPEGKQGRLGSYIHAGGKIGVVLALTAASMADTETEPFQALAKDLCMHIAASEPYVVSADKLDPALVAKQTEIFTAQAAETGKPAQILEKIALGRLAKWKKEISLLNQPFVKDMETTVEAHLSQVARQHLSGPVQVVQFVRYRLGEGLEKKQSDLAAEIAALQK